MEASLNTIVTSHKRRRRQAQIDSNPYLTADCNYIVDGMLQPQRLPTTGMTFPDNYCQDHDL